MGINILINKYQQSIIETINQAEMPPAITKLVLQSILQKVNEAEAQMIQKEAREAEAQAIQKEKAKKEEHEEDNEEQK